MKLFCILALFSVFCAVAFAETACQLQRSQAKPGEFKPTCDKDGEYAKMQCRDGWCWCINKDGEMLGKSQKGKVDC